MRTAAKFYFGLFCFSTLLFSEQPNLGRRPVTAQDILDDPSAVLEIDEPDISQLPPLGEPEGSSAGGTPPPSLGRKLGKSPAPDLSKPVARPALEKNVLADIAETKKVEHGKEVPVVPKPPAVAVVPPAKAAADTVPQPATAPPKPVLPPSLAGATTLPLVLSPQFFGQQGPRTPAQSTATPVEKSGASAPPVTEMAPTPATPTEALGKVGAETMPLQAQAGTSLIPVALPPLAGNTERVPMLPSTAMPPLPGVPDVAVILVHNQFYPSRIKLKDGMQTRLIFTTTNKKPAALIIERLQIQRWIAKEAEPQERSGNDRMKWEATREVASNRITEILVEPKAGSYSFHDAITGATGELVVE